MMRKYLSIISISLLVLFSSGGGFALLLRSPPEGSAPASIFAPGPLEIANSTNPAFPTTLYPHNCISQCYSLSETDYYYQTGLVDNYYHIIWIRPKSTEDTYDLYLYENDYTTLLTTSMRGSGKMNWVVFNANTYYYPKVYVQSGSVGYADMNWVNCPTPSSNIYIGEPYSDSLGGPDYLTAYTLYLANDTTYDIELTVSSGDIDLYLYYVGSGDAANATEYMAYSATPGVAVDEKITNFQPQYPGYHVAVLVRGSEPSYYTIKYNYHKEPFDFFGVLLPALIIISVLSLALFLGRKYYRTKK